MKSTFLHLAGVLLLLAGCSRQNPGSDNPVAPDIVTLKPERTINLLPHVPEPSGLAYNRTANTLMVVSDALPDIFEIGLDGALIRSIPAAGADLEGVAVSRSGDTLYVVEERNQLVVSCTRSGERLGSFPVKVATLDNNALEGVAVDAAGHLWVLNEKEPRMLFEFAGPRELSRREITHVADLSDVCADPAGDALWIVSDESRRVIRISRSGALLGEWALPFDKGEGIAIANGNMYICNDATAQLFVFAVPQ